MRQISYFVESTVPFVFASIATIGTFLVKTTIALALYLDSREDLARAQQHLLEHLGVCFVVKLLNCSVIEQCWHVIFGSI